VHPLRGLVTADRLYILAEEDHLTVFTFEGMAVEKLTAPAEAGGEQLLTDATDLFASGEGRHVVLEMALRLLVWDAAQSSFLCEIAPIEQLGGLAGASLQGRPASCGQLAVWLEDGGRQVQLWEPEREPRLASTWCLPDEEPSAETEDQNCRTTVAQVLSSPAHMLLGVVDSKGDFYLILQGSSCCQDLGPPRPLIGPGGAGVLPHSVGLGAGLLSFVEGLDLGTQERCLHVWDFLDEGVRLCEEPQRYSFPFDGHGSATVSVPRPLLRRFVLVKSCSVRSARETLVSLHLFDLKAGCCAHKQGTIALDSSLFRRAHPMAEHILAFWTSRRARMPGLDLPLPEAAMEQGRPPRLMILNLAA